MNERKRKPVIAVTLGDVAGIGPETVARLLNDDQLLRSMQIVVIGNAAVLRRARRIIADQLSFTDRINSPSELVDLSALLRDGDVTAIQRELPAISDQKIALLDPAGDTVSDIPYGAIDARAGDAAFQYLTCAIRLAQQGCVAAMTTAPLNKAALHAAGHVYPGHTEILAEQCGVSDFAMMLYVSEAALRPARDLVRSDSDSASLLPRLGATGAGRSAVHDSEAVIAGENGSFLASSKSTHPGCGLAIAHVTLHQSVASVPGDLTSEAIVEKSHLVDAFLRRIGCRRRAIAIAALNPHGGENGLFGDEEGRTIEPAVRTAKEAGLSVTGPVPIDTLIRRAIAGEFDGVVAMYHDQGHIPIKLIAFDRAVNVTLGLPIIRTSPTHGTAFDIAGKGVADADGLREAVLTAQKLAISESDLNA